MKAGKIVDAILEGRPSRSSSRLRRLLTAGDDAAVLSELQSATPWYDVTYFQVCDEVAARQMPLSTAWFINSQDYYKTSPEGIITNWLVYHRTPESEARALQMCQALSPQVLQDTIGINQMLRASANAGSVTLCTFCVEHGADLHYMLARCVKEAHPDQVNTLAQCPGAKFDPAWAKDGTLRPAIRCLTSPHALFRHRAEATLRALMPIGYVPSAAVMAQLL